MTRAHLFPVRSSAQAAETVASRPQQREGRAATAGGSMRPRTKGRPARRPHAGPTCWTDLSRPTATPRRSGSSCGRRWRCSSGSAQPRPRTCSPNWTPSPARDPYSKPWHRADPSAAQIERMPDISQLTAVTEDVVGTAREADPDCVSRHNERPGPGANTRDFQVLWCSGAFLVSCSVSVFESVFVMMPPVCGHDFCPPVTAGLAHGSTVRVPACAGGFLLPAGSGSGGVLGESGCEHCDLGFPGDCCLGSGGVREFRAGFLRAF